MAAHGCRRGVLSAPKSVAIASGLEPSGTSVLLMRTIGAVISVVGLGRCAHVAGALAESRRWMLAATASDALDTVVCGAAFVPLANGSWGAASCRSPSSQLISLPTGLGTVPR